mgnify:FL=1
MVHISVSLSGQSKQAVLKNACLGKSFEYEWCYSNDMIFLLIYAVINIAGATKRSQIKL